MNKAELLDTFALVAMHAYVSGNNYSGSSWRQQDDLADASYRMAGAMLEARDRHLELLLRAKDAHDAKG